MKYLLAIAALGVALIGYGVVTQGIQRDPAPAALSTPSQATLQGLSSQALAGKPIYEQACAACHGGAGDGSDKGPPLVHKTYNPGHHADEAFFRAARNGVKQHHWRFGDMPPRPEVSETEVAQIVRYVRELQEANGIYYEPHRM